jgi:hypothetical protein
MNTIEALVALSLPLSLGLLAYTGLLLKGTEELEGKAEEAGEEISRLKDRLLSVRARGN